jgi:hypothetical protein
LTVSYFILFDVSYLMDKHVVLSKEKYKNIHFT